VPGARWSIPRVRPRPQLLDAACRGLRLGRSRSRGGGCVAVAESVAVSGGGCIASALTDWSAVEVVGAVLGLSAAEQDEVWARWRQGESLWLIARRLGRRGRSVRAFVLPSGGGQQHPPHRAVRCLGMAERDRDQPWGGCWRAVPAAGGLARASTLHGVVGAGQQRRPPPLPGPGRRRRRLPAGAPSGRNRPSWPWSRGGARWWKPSWPSAGHPSRSPAGCRWPTFRSGAGGSHETIDRSLFVQTKGALRRERQRCLPTGRVRRSPRAKRLAPGTRPAPRPPPQQPATPAAADRAVPGQWEGDLVLGKRPSAVGTLVERHSRSVCCSRSLWVTAEPMRPELTTTAVLRLAQQLRRSRTWDHGREMADHLQFTIDSGVPVFFCDPRSPGSAAPTKPPTACSATTSPRAADLRPLDQAALDGIAAERNGHPRRQPLGSRTPSQALAEASP
jgi:IS30 family transposase